MLNVKCQACQEIKRQMSIMSNMSNNIMSNDKCQLSKMSKNVKWQIPDGKNVKCQTPNVKLQRM